MSIRGVGSVITGVRRDNKTSFVDVGRVVSSESALVALQPLFLFSAAAPSASESCRARSVSRVNILTPHSAERATAQLVDGALATRHRQRVSSRLGMAVMPYEKQDAVERQITATARATIFLAANG